MPLPGLLSTDPNALGNTGLAIGLLQGGAPSRYPSYFGPALAQGLSIGSQMQLEGQQANARRAFIEAETTNRLMQAQLQQYQLEVAKRSDAAIQALGQSLPDSQRQAFLANPKAYLDAIAKAMEPYTLSADQTRFQGNAPVAMGISKPQLVDVPFPGQPGVTQKMWLRPDQSQGTAVGGQAMPDLLNPAVFAAKVRLAQESRPAVNVAVNTGQSFWKAVADKVGENVASQGAAAQNALMTINSANQIRQAVDSGQVLAGPGATIRLQGAQVAQTLGFGTGADAVTRTREAIQGLAQLALGARSALKGQGQISDYEGKLLQKATTGEIQDLTIPEIRVIADVADRAARIQIRQNAKNVERMKASPESGPIAPYLDVPEPPAYQAPPAPEVTRSIGGKTYVKRNGQWFEQ